MLDRPEQVIASITTAISPQYPTVHIRWMIRRDMPEVLKIDQRAMEEAWSEENFLKYLRQRNCIGMTAEAGELVVGFQLYSLHKRKIVLDRMCVEPGWRRRHVGTAMCARLYSKLAAHRRTRVEVVVPESLLEAQLFFRANKYIATATHRNYFDQEAGYEMVQCLDGANPLDPPYHPNNRISGFVSQEE